METHISTYKADPARDGLVPKKVYIAGPMRGLALYNFPAFDHASKVLRARGFEVISPADMDREHGFDPVKDMDQSPVETIEAVMARDLAAICTCDAVALLPGWESSEGVAIELPVAIRMGKVIFDADSGKILDEEYVLSVYTSKRYVFAEPLPRETEVDRHLGIGGAPMRASTLPDDGKARKEYPVASGLLDYFPDACVAVAHVSYVGNEQHHPGKPLHWDRSKSADEADTMQRHFLQRGTRDKDTIRHSAKMAWRALALLQKEIESEVK
jgi:nucleoside 2-deoxyribosyltransferase